MSEAALKKVMDHASAGLAARKAFFDTKAELVVEIARAMAVCLAGGGKIMFCGNGGSAADCQHLAAEFTNRIRMERPPLPGLALTTDTSALTAIGNDYSFDEVFSKQLQALGRPGDMLVGFSTSGTSTNVIRAMREAKRNNIVTVGMTGQSGAEIASVSDFLVTVPSGDTMIIQEIHISAGHMMCFLVDHFLFEAVSELTPYLPESKG
ncbi:MULTISPECIES: D-sedoheptulose 7-phosphate isomerase [unclassified Pseudodesulfovibrio]|uniref:D-sedoheptulose 7-phosphate isomerase n=1 Tax=unclassified Pseudodesulfovibrio TaxID=2661612 RepID=UPI000FEBE17B|nr:MULTISPECIES: D-sedoheptulose 7-phosphate isomerase [unclassified Pseudodesulfovibrio]MCJ2165814.1 D-sedoheptulose 7-phosphate isomerase [Pseudodesulfovibrio sp. S3-i]RWU02755.1 SIS domain-containing protein [Pseudodesulfovibrio sp. S3]